VVHRELRDWLEEARDLHPHAFSSHRRVLECGSMDINGSPRPFFEGCEYVGVDWRDGPGVDVVSLAHEFEGGPFDTVISTEMLEHDPYWRLSVQRMIDLLAPHGTLIISAAGPGRTEHRRDESPGGDYYANVEPLRLLIQIMTHGDFRQVWLVQNEQHHDVYLLCDWKYGGEAEKC
jgi:SAM-dependent methyltransferase